MTLLELMKKVVGVLEAKELKYALAGGMAASLYRGQARATSDLDFLLMTKHGDDKAAIQIIESVGLKPTIGRLAELDGGPMFAIKKQSTPICIVVGRNPNDRSDVGLDFLFSSIPWVSSALERAQLNQIDFGFSKIPCMTKEDLLLAKFHSLAGNSQRFKDLDDIQSIFAEQKNIDLTYISSKMRELKIPLPRAFEPYANDILRRVSKEVRRSFAKKSSAYR